MRFVPVVIAEQFDKAEGAGEGVSARSNCKLSLAVMLLCFRGTGEMISDCSLSDLSDSSSVRSARGCVFGGREWE